MRFNTLKMICSLYKNKKEMDLFIKVNGLDLINKILENEDEFNEQFKSNNEKELFKARKSMDISGKNSKKKKKKLKIM